MKEKNTYNEELGGKNLLDSLRVNPFTISDNFFENQEAQILSQIQLKKNLNIEASESMQVPSGYFETLEDNVFSKIFEADLKDNIQVDGFTVPHNYFETSAQDIETRIAEENLRQAIPSVDLQVPEGYFATLEDQILDKVAEQKLRDQVGVEDGFAVPESYFDDSVAAIEANILEEKWSSSFGKNSFTVPESYFEKASQEIYSKTIDATTQETPILTLPKRPVWRRYAAAAAIAVTLGVGSYFGYTSMNNDNSAPSYSKTDINLDDVSDEEILNYLAQVSDGEDLIQLSQYVSDENSDNISLDGDVETKDIEEYLNYML